MALPFLAPLRRFFAGLRYPQLFAVFALLFAADLLVPDPIPFIDELLLLTGTALLGRLRRRGPVDGGPR